MQRRAIIMDLQETSNPPFIRGGEYEHISTPPGQKKCVKLLMHC